MTSTPSDQPHADRQAENIVALCTGATGVSSLHLMRHMQDDPRFTKIYGVARRDLYDIDTSKSNLQQLKLDLLDAENVKSELKAQGITDGTTI